MIPACSPGWWKEEEFTKSFTDCDEVVRDAGGRLVVHHADSFDGVRVICLQLLLEDCQVDALAPLAVDLIHFEVEALHEVDPNNTELPH